jgi:hypothetical protein
VNVVYEMKTYCKNENESVISCMVAKKKMTELTLR